MKKLIGGALVALGLTFSATAAMAADGNYGCTLPANELSSWAAKGLRGIDASIASKFKLWKAVTAKGLPAAAAALCTKLPKTSFYLKAAKAGGISRAELVVAQANVKVYRAFSTDKFACSENSPAGKIGGWWSLLPFPSSKAAYRKANGVCHSWNNFSHKVVCTLKKGTVVAVGPTQSAACKPGPNACAKKPAWPALFAATPDHQVFLNTYGLDAAALDTFLTGCTVSEWTAKE